MIQDIYSQALNKKDKLDPGVSALVDKMIIELLEKQKQLKKMI